MNGRSFPSVAIETLGCKLNLADSDRLARDFVNKGYIVVDSEEHADVYIVNTCTVTHRADRKARQALRSAKKRNPGALIVATGCYAQRDGAAIRDLPGVSLVVGNDQKARIVDDVLAMSKPQTPYVRPEHGSHQFGIPGRSRAFVKIQEGCDQVCAYCIVPIVRGRERSIPPDELIREVRCRVNEGYKEIVLTGTQLGSYGFDLESVTLYSLIAGILEQSDVARLRVSSLQPQEITVDLLSLWNNDARLCPHFHVPLQSGSDRILGRMRRKYDSSEYRRAVQRIREMLSPVTVTTDVIVGFPDETEDDFRATLEVCVEANLSAIHVFPYSSRPRTSAAHFKQKVDAVTIKRRSRQVRDLGATLEKAHRANRLGSEEQVLWEKCVANADGLPIWSGLTEGYIRAFVASPRVFSGLIARCRVLRVIEEGVWVELTDGI
jgi:threonylcarbamoyladenosine tRNA methylthiotransferase MtaB